MSNIKKSNSKTTIEISFTTLFKIVAVILLVFFLYFIRDILLLVFVALILASAIGPWVNWLEKWKVPRTLGTIFIYVLAFGLFFFSILLMIKPISIEVKNLVDDFPSYWQQLSFGWTSFSNFSESHGLQQEVINGIKSLQSALTAMATNIFGGAISFVGGAFSVIMVLVMTFYLSVYDKQMKRKIRSLLPVKYQTYSTHLINRMQEKIGLWLRGQIILSLIIFTLALIGLSLLGVKYAWVLALLAGVTEIIPYFGPLIGGVPAVFIALTQSPLLALLVIGLFFLIHQTENYLITPQVMRKAVGLNPVIVIVSMMVGAKVAGIAGIVLAIPVATALGVLIDDLFEHRRSGFSTSDYSIED